MKEAPLGSSTTLDNISVLILVDECHTGSEENSWGEAVKELVDAGALCALFTATPLREDGKRIPGFRFRVEEGQPTILHTTSSGSEPNLVRVDIYDVTRGVLTLIPDHQTPFKAAWQEKALCKVGRVPFDVDLSRIESGQPIESGLQLSRIENATDSRKALGRAVRNKIVIRRGAEHFSRQLRHFKEFCPDTAGIIFCGNDNDKEDPSINKHAGQIKAEIQRLNPDWTIIIATSADDGKSKLEAFQNGVGDVLIVKQMASIGLDIPRRNYSGRTGLELKMGGSRMPMGGLHRNGVRRSRIAFFP